MRRPRSRFSRLFFLFGCLGGLSSLFAQTWTVVNSGLNGVNAAQSVAFGNGRFVATFGGSGLITTVRAGWSLDGITWNPAGSSSTSLSQLGSVFFLNGAFYHVSSAGLFRSVDGDSWQALPTTIALGGLYPRGLATDGRGFLTGSSNLQIQTPLFTPDLASFRAAAPLPETANLPVNLDEPACGQGRYLMPYTVHQPNGSIAPKLASTRDAQTWTLVAGISTVQSITYGNGRFVVHAGTKTFQSTDGITFTDITSPALPINTSSIRFAGGRFISSGRPHASLDGQAWTPFGTVPAGTVSLGFSSIVYGNGRYVGVGTGFDGQTVRDFIASLETPAPPLLTSQPAAVTVAIGHPAALRVSAENPTSVTYQWFKDGQPIAGAIFPSYLLSNATAGDAGNYRCELRNSTGSVTSDTVSITVLPAEAAGRLINLSVRTFAGTGERTFIAGFALTGPASKPVVVRGIGPRLADFGVAGTLADPSLEFFSGQNFLQANDNWSVDDGRTLGAFPLIPGSRDAVLRSVLPAGAYTAQLKGIANTTGNALLEIYDGATSDGLTRLTNLSVRAQLDPAQAIIAGFVIIGETPVSIVLRAAGPALSAFGLTGVLADPKLTLYRDQTKLAENDNWTNDDGRELGAFPFATGSRDAALRVSLPPGSYTVFTESSIASGAGLVLFEVYENP